MENEPDYLARTGKVGVNVRVKIIPFGGMKHSSVREGNIYMFDSRNPMTQILQQMG